MIKRGSYSGLKRSINLTFSRYLLLGIRLLLNVFLRIIFQDDKFQYFFFNKKHEILKRWLLKKYGKLIPDTVNLPKEFIKTNKIWIFWWQGKKNMPPIIKACYSSVLRHSDGYEVILVTKYNYNEYVKIPRPIIEKVENNSITLAHFSDILRVSLLYEWGGLWLDSTFFVTECIPDECFDSNFYSIKLDRKENWSVTRFRWSVFIIGTKKRSPIMKIMRDLLIEYNLNENKLIDYLLVDYFFDILIDKYPEFKKIIDDTLYTNENLYVLSQKMNSKFSEEEYENMTNNTMFFKLTYKFKFELSDINGDETFYSRIVNGNI